MQIVKKNEATATYRRMYFHCVDATDGMTPETGEEGGQPQISANGEAFTDTGIGTLVAIGNGRYYAVLTQTAVNIADRSVIEGRYKSANTAESVAASVLVLENTPLDAVTAVATLNGVVDTHDTDIKALINHATYGLSALHTDIAALTDTGSGDTQVDHDTGGVDNLRFVTGAGAGIDDAVVLAYLKTDYDNGSIGPAFIQGRTNTDADGRWEKPMNLDSGFTYTIVFYKQGAYETSTAEVTI